MESYKQLVNFFCELAENLIKISEIQKAFRAALEP